VRSSRSLSKAQLKLYARLREKKIRDAEQLFLAEGERVVHQLLCTLPHPDMLVALLFNSHTPPRQPVTLYHDKHFFLSPREFARIADVEEPQSLMAIFKQPQHTFADILHRQQHTPLSLILALDGLQDAGNVGTVLRTAAWFNVSAVISDTRTADFFNPKVVRSSAGSIFSLLLVRSSNFLHDLETLKATGFTCYASAPTGTSLESVEFAPRSLLIIGSEGAGVSPSVMALADTTICIQGNSKAVESLNAAVAAGIIVSAMSYNLKLV
jgi:TrmH family RNA methyltransferase